MKAFIRHILRSADGNKGQMAVIVLTIAVVTAMIFAAFSMYDVFFNVNIAEYDRVADGADMLLGTNGGTTEFFSRARVQRVIDSEPEGEVVSVLYFAKINTILKTEEHSRTVLVEATDLEEYLAAHELRYVDAFTAETVDADVKFEEAGGYSSVIIGKSFAEANSLKAGDLVEIYLPTYDSYTQVLVRYVSVNEGIFSSSADVNVLVDFAAVGNLGQVSAAYISFSDPALFDKYEALFAEYFPALDCTEGNNLSGVLDIVRNNTLLLSVGLIFLIATMMLILYTSYVIIARNRMHEMVVFKAAGATPAQVAGIMFGEVLFYALIGGAIGLLLGRTAMGIAVKALLPLAEHAVTYPFWKYLVSFIIAVLVTVAATSVPVASVSRKTIRELTGDAFKLVKKVKPPILILSTVLLAASAVAYALTKGIALAAVSVVLLAATVFWAYCAVYYAVKLIGAAIAKISRGGTAYIAGLGVTRNNAMHTVTTLVAVVVTFAFLISEVVSLVQTAIVPFRSRYTADVVVTVNDGTGAYTYDDVRGIILDTDGIEWAGYFNSQDYLLADGETEWTIYGVSDLTVLRHCTENLTAETAELWAITENPLVLSNDMMLRLGLEIGDEVSFNPDSPDYGSETHTFTVVGVDYAVSEYDRVGYCGFDFISKMKNSAQYLAGISEDADATEVFVELRERIENTGIPLAYALEFDEWAYAATRNLSGVSTLLTLLQIMVYVVAAIGVVNVSIVTFYDRRAEFRLFKVAGMSSADFMRYAVCEGATAASAGCLLGFVAGYAVNLLVPSLGSIISKYMPLDPFPLPLLIITCGAFALFMAFWTIIAAANRKTNLISVNERSGV